MTGWTRRRLLAGLSGTATAAFAAPLLAGAREDWFGVARGELEGQVALVTGSTDGLGRQVALELAALGAEVLVHGRNRERGEAVVRDIRDLGGRASFYPADFAVLAEVRELAEAIRSDHDRLDLLINNAGIWRREGDDTRHLSEDGHELMFAVNYLSGFLLTHELRGLLAASAPARVIKVASRAQAPLDFDDPMLERGFSPSRAYAQSKLAQILFTLDIAEAFAADGITVNSLHPATLMDTTMVRLAGMAPRATVEEGVEAVMQLAVSPAYAERGGLYLEGLEEARAHPQAYDETARTALRALSERLVARD